jgi:hypothetical protein
MFRELFRPVLRWLFWKKYRPWVLVIVLVVAVAAIARITLGGSAHHNPAAPGQSRPAATAPAPSASSAAVPSPAVASPAAAKSVSIYSWLPFTQRDLAAAAAVTVRVTADYNTFTYTESAASYAGQMGSLITSELAATLQTAYSAPGVAQLRTAQKQVSTGTAAVDSLRAFGPASITFVVTGGQRLSGTRVTSTTSTQYAVTVTGSGASWQVSDIELASAGNS